MGEDTGRYGHSIFCDDVRVERSNKAIFIGVYSDKMIVPSFPHDLRLSIISYLRTFADDPIKSLKYQIYRDAHLLMEATPDDSFPDTTKQILSSKDRDMDLVTDPTRMPPNHPTRRHTLFSISAQVTGVKLDGPSVIRVRFETERGVVWAGTLPVVGRPSESSIGT